MIQCELFGLSSAVLAGILIPVEYLQLGQLRLVAGTLDQINKTYHRGDLKHLANRMYLSPAICQHFRLTTKYQHHCSADTTEIEWLIALVKNQD